jgi:hypothetical protein
MTEVTNDLIYEVLKSIPGCLGNIEDRMSSLAVRMDSMNEQMRGFALGLNASNTDIANIYRVLGTLDHRVARIERRLEIADELVK